ncbi:MAG: serine/threonine protein kinase [Gammaproteobacteria bacterium]|nr:serine/threonine protein kinase [Gammaproteobacteria bacterium]
MRVAIVHSDDNVCLVLAQLVSIDAPDAEVDSFTPDNWDAKTAAVASYDVLIVDLALPWLPPAFAIPPCIAISKEPLPAVEMQKGCVASVATTALSRAAVVAAMREARRTLDREVQSAIACDATLEMPQAEPLVSTAAALDEPVIGIKGYTAFKLIGRGGMATVYLAEREADGARVAIKILDRALSEDDIHLERFIKEFDLHSRIDSRHVARIIEHGFTDRHIYIVMEYFAGGDMKAVLGRPLRPRRAVMLLYQLGIALSDVHAHRIVHCDLKPQNIMFRSDGSAVLMDFGVSRLTERTGAQTTSGDEISGTPYYMSPEQVAGRKVDARSDLYSLGALFFEMLTGAKPYQANSWNALVYMHANLPPPKLPDPLAAFQPIIDRTMAKAPEERFASAEALLAYVRERWARASAGRAQ